MALLKNICTRLLKASNPSYIRPLIIPSDLIGKDPTKTVQEVIQAVTEFTVGEIQHYTPKPTKQFRHELSNLLPDSQDELPLRKMTDSFDHAIIPLSTDFQLRDKYTTLIGGVRFGRLLEDMDVFSVSLCLKHILNPKQKDSVISPYSIVTALVDKIDIHAHFVATSDIKISGQITWVGKSSLQVSIECHQKDPDHQWKLMTEATFVMAARNSTNTGSGFVNPLKIETEEERSYFSKGETNKIERLRLSKQSLFGKSPSPEENDLIHQFFIQSLDNSALSFKARIKPPNSEWMENAKLKTVILCHPEYRNRFNKIFGGFIMRQAAELAWVNSYVFSGQTPAFKHVEDIIFKNPVELGSLLYFSSQVCYTQDNHIQTRVSAEIFDAKQKKSTLTNVFEFTFTVEESVPKILPKAYHEAMMYLNSRRQFLATMKKC